jgi:putative phage-type endonuclease
MEQGSQEWFSARHGNASASRIKDIIAKTKSGYSASRDNYMTDLVLERFGVFQDQLDTAPIRWGNEQEPFARAMYEVNENVMVNECGFILHPTIDKAGASPDGLIADDGVLEIKCPNTKTHFEYLLAGEPPSQYVPQMAWQIICTGRKWADFVSYDPRAPEGLQYFKVRYVPEQSYIEMLESEVKQFLIEVEAKYQQLKNKLDELKG